MIGYDIKKKKLYLFVNMSMIIIRYVNNMRLFLYILFIVVFLK